MTTITTENSKSNCWISLPAAKSKLLFFNVNSQLREISENEILLLDKNIKEL